MIGLKKNNEYFDLYPGTIIQRERNNPFFIIKTSTGQDGIGSEISYPFELPPSDKNNRMLSFANLIPSRKEKITDVLLENDGLPLSTGKLIIDSLTSNLVRANVGKFDTHLYSNTSEFFQRIKDKLLSDMTLGGDRVFPWAGYSRSSAGFWKHVHDTWGYINDMSGDYVFYPIYNDTYLGGVTWGQNTLRYNVTQKDVEIDPAQNVTSLTPAIYVSYVLKNIFNENGYKLVGELLDDPDFRKLTMASFYGVYWSQVVYDDNAEEPKLIPTPLSSVTIKLSQHMPPKVTMSEFIVEMQKFLPIGFEINDNSRECKIVWLHKLTKAGSRDYTKKVNQAYTTQLGEGESVNKVFGIKRNVHSSDSYSRQATNLKDYLFDGEQVLVPSGSAAALTAYRVLSSNEYFKIERTSGPLYRWRKLGNNNGGYEPAGATDFIESNISHLPLETEVYFEFPLMPGSIRRPPIGYVPHCEVEGNWFGKEGDKTEWGLRFMFYRGKNLPLDGGFCFAPLATNSVFVYQKVGANWWFSKVDGTWSQAYECGVYGLNKFWDKWLRNIGAGETFIGKLYLPFYEYRLLKWSDVILIENTAFLITKVKELLPYKGNIDIEAIRLLE